jgi:hypothetical protein
MTRLRSFLVALALSFALPSPVRAEGDQRKAAGEHYQRGLELANRSDYKAALEEFDRAYALSPNFAVLYNIGQADVALGRPQKAMAALERYLADGGEQVPSERRSDVERQIALLESSFAQLLVATEPPGARVTVDGAEAGTTPLREPVKLVAGTHVISASKAGTVTASRVVTLAEGVQEKVTLTLAALPAAATQPSATEQPAKNPVEPKPVPPPTEPKPEQAANERAASRFPTGYVLIGSGVVLGGVTVAQYLVNHHRVEEFRANEAALQTDVSPGRNERQAENNELADTIQRGSVVTVVLASVSGALVAAGAVLLLTDHGAGNARERASASNVVVEVPRVAVTRDAFALSWGGRW